MLSKELLSTICLRRLYVVCNLVFRMYVTSVASAITVYVSAAMALENNTSLVPIPTWPGDGTSACRTVVTIHTGLHYYLAV